MSAGDEDTVAPARRTGRGNAGAAAPPKKAAPVGASFEDQASQTSGGIDSAPPPRAEQGQKQPIQLESRQADAAPAPTEVLSRRPRTIAGDNRLDIPEKRKRRGWDYEWKTARVMGMPVDPSENAEVFEQGWRPVAASAMPELCPPGYQGQYVERLGMILYTRPLHLSEEARREDFNIAETQKADKLQAASAVPTSRPGLINPTAPEIKIEGEVGVHKQKSEAAA